LNDIYKVQNSERSFLNQGVLLQSLNAIKKWLCGTTEEDVYLVGPVCGNLLWYMCRLRDDEFSLFSLSSFIVYNEFRTGDYSSLSCFCEVEY
jgi:hypothetical protein